MNFTPHELDLIHSRKKTQVRQPVALLKPPRPQILEKVCRYHEGRMYKAVPPTGHPRHHHLPITIMHVVAGRLGDIDQPAVRREGFMFITQYRKHWETLHGTWTVDQPVWILTFQVGDHRDQFDTPRLLASIGHVGHVEYETVPGREGGKGVHRWPAEDEHTEDYTDRTDLAMQGHADPGEGLTNTQLAPYVLAAHATHNVRRLVPIHGNLARITDEIVELRQHLGTGTDGHVDRDLHRDLTRLERARDALQRRLAS